MIVLQICI